MKNRGAIKLASLFVFAVALAAAPAAAALSELPAGTRFLVEIREMLDAGFEAQTLENLYLADGDIIPAGARLKGGRVTFTSEGKILLRFEQVETHRGKLPIAASVPGMEVLVLEKGARLQLQLQESLIFPR